MVRGPYCNHGHRMTEANTKLSKRTRRDGAPYVNKVCRTCSRRTTRVAAKIKRKQERDKARITTAPEELTYTEQILDLDNAIEIASAYDKRNLTRRRDALVALKDRLEFDRRRLMIAGRTKSSSASP